MSPSTTDAAVEPSFPYNIRFPGQYYQAETGLNQNYFRDYDPQVGRYGESDPIGLKAGINTYAYVGDDPVNLLDPLGLQTVPGTASAATYWFQFGAGEYAMWLNFQRMDDLNWMNSDGYFHCLANCQAANKGEGGAGAAWLVSYFRTDVYGRLTEPDWQDDAKANKCGQRGGDCKKTCASFIPLSSPGRPLFPAWRW
jgi:RHS repeat-associated protein